MTPNSDLLTYSQWMGILTAIFAVITLLGFIVKWSFRFRLVGITSFMGVLTIGIFALSLGLYTRTEIPGAVRYTLVYDTGGAQTVIVVPPTIGESELEATMRQAAGDLYSFGRRGKGTRSDDDPSADDFTSKIGVSLPLYLGEVRRALSARADEKMEIDIFPDSIARLKNSQA